MAIANRTRINELVSWIQHCYSPLTSQFCNSVCHFHDSISRLMLWGATTSNSRRSWWSRIQTGGGLIRSVEHGGMGGCFSMEDGKPFVKWILWKNRTRLSASSSPEKAGIWSSRWVSSTYEIGCGETRETKHKSLFFYTLCWVYVCCQSHHF